MENFKKEFDFLSLAKNRLEKRFEKEIYLRKIIPMKSLYQFCAVMWSFKKETTRKMLRSLALRYSSWTLNYKGLIAYSLATAK